MSVPSQLLKARGLWARTSAKGDRYLIGRLASVKVLILANKDRPGADHPTYHLFFADGEKAQPAKQSRRAPRSPRHDAGEPEFPNDPVDDIGRGDR